LEDAYENGGETSCSNKKDVRCKVHCEFSI
jgi:hypothetical protein